MSFLDELKQIDKQKKQLEKVGAENVKFYCLVNNEGFTFLKNGLDFDARHILNTYGVGVDYFCLMSKNGSKDFDTFSKMIDFLKGV